MSSRPTDILIIEDNPTDVELTLRALRKANLLNPLRVVEDGAEALAYLFGPEGAAERAAPPLPRLILLDLKVPKVSGLEVLRQIKTQERTRRIPVVVLTSSREAPDVQESYRLGANSYIVKPVSFDKFIDAVAQVGLYWMLLNTPPS
jgi:CheY-like chemotaxis protein